MACEQHTARPGKFFGVYILYSNDSKGKGDVYIGFTVNPQRRIRQHNREIKGGAWKTGKKKGTWDMVLITHGFPTRLSALQFEWAWQNPQKSKRLSHISKKTTKENKFKYKLRVLSEILNSGPWYRLPLTIQWLKQEYLEEFPINKPPPVHMPIAYGPITTAKKVTTSKDASQTSSDAQSVQISAEGNGEVQRTCGLCGNDHLLADQIFLQCIVKSCNLVAHMKCMAETFLCQEKQAKTAPKNFLVPVSGTCPRCNHSMMWGDLLKQRKYSVDDDNDDEEEDDDDDDDEGQYGGDGTSQEEFYSQENDPGLSSQQSQEY